MSAGAHVLILGGSGFIGGETARRLLAAGFQVTCLSRRGAAPAAGVRVLRADRRDPGALAAALQGARFDATLDACAYDAPDVEQLLGLPQVTLGRYVLISSGQVYLVTDAPRVPAREPDSDRPLAPAPAAGTPDHAQWTYGVGKRRAERAALARCAEQGRSVVVLRLPVVHGAGDPTLRLWAYLERMRDGGPLLLPDGGAQPTRYLWVGDVARAVLRVLSPAAAREQVYNLAQPEIVTLRDFLARAARTVEQITGRSPVNFVDIPADDLEREGLDRTISPLSGRWTSVPDPARAEAEWGSTGTSLDVWLPAVVRAQLERAPERSHAGYARRGREIEVAMRRLAASRT
jgi:nucleoside-diphosphate-sugar epimerase